MSKTKLRRRRKPMPEPPKLPISNITDFPSGMSHADLRRQFPIRKTSIVELIAVSPRKLNSLVEALSGLPFAVRFDRF